MLCYGLLIWVSEQTRRAIFSLKKLKLISLDSDTKLDEIVVAELLRTVSFSDVFV